MPSQKNYNAFMQEIEYFKKRVIKLDTEAKSIVPIHLYLCNCKIPHKSMNYFHLEDGRVWWVESSLYDKINSIAKELKDA